MKPEQGSCVDKHRQVWRAKLYGSCVVVVFSAIVFSLYGLDLPLNRDNAIYLYSAQKLLDGVPPYISIFDIKTPLTSFVTAGLLLPSHSIFDEPLHGVRLGNMAIVTATALLTYRLAAKVFGGKGTALFAPLAMLGFQGYIVMAAMGARPKVLLIFFMLLVLIFLWDRRWFAAGLASALCAFTWQVSGVVLVAALVFAFIAGERYRPRAPIRLLGGFFSVTAALSAYFVYMGAFQEFLDGSLLAHLYVERTEAQNELRNIVHSIETGFPFASSLIVLGLLCFVPYLACKVWKEWVKQRSAGPELAYLLMLVMFSAWSLFDFQSYPDFFVFLPFAALGIQLMLQSLGSVIGDKFGFDAKHRDFTVQLVLVCFLLTSPFFAFVGNRVVAGVTLDDEKARFESIINTAIGGGNISEKRLLVLEIPEIPALLGLDNNTPYVVHMDGIDQYVASRFSGGIQGWFDAMETKDPDLLIVRTWTLRRYSPENEKAVLEWLNASFEPGPVDGGISTWLPNK